MTRTRSKSTNAMQDGPTAQEQSRKKRKCGQTGTVTEVEGLCAFTRTDEASTPIKASRFFHVVAASPVPKLIRPVSNERYGLIQEEIKDNLYYLLVQSILWNQTWGRSARPVLDTILSIYPTPEKLAKAALSELTLIIRPIGLHNRRAKRLIDLAQVWLAAPPCKERRYQKVGYPVKQSGKDVKPTEMLSESDTREGWEVAHLPGVGAYALDSYRIFHRDKLRGVPQDAEPEWKRVVATDKELRAWLGWKWQKEGYLYDILTGKITANGASDIPAGTADNVTGLGPP